MLEKMGEGYGTLGNTGQIKNNVTGIAQQRLVAGAKMLGRCMNGNVDAGGYIQAR